jgi:lipooligosaccharide transport system permease protein
VKTIAFLSPLYHLVEIIRPLVIGNIGYGIIVHLAWVIVFILIFTAVPVNLLRKKLVK